MLQLAKKRRGLTLIELLIVISIMLLITAATVPMLAPALSNRAVREGARIVSTMFGAARARAMATGRPVGVIVERTGSDPQAGLQLAVAEMTAPYAGDSVNSYVEVESGEIKRAGYQIQVKPEVWQQDYWKEHGIRVGDLIRLNFQGPLYEITGPDTAPADGYVDTFPVTTNPQLPSAPDNNPGTRYRAAYQLFRQPARTSAPLVQLPRNVVIDMSQSGGGTGTFDLATTTPLAPVIVMFSSEGNVETVYFTDSSGVAQVIEHPLQSLHFLIGRNEKIIDPDPTKTNLADKTNIWVSIGPQTGLVTSAENLAYSPSAATPSDKLKEARQFARQRQSIGGR